MAQRLAEQTVERKVVMTGNQGVPAAQLLNAVHRANRHLTQPNPV